METTEAEMKAATVIEPNQTPKKHIPALDGVRALAIAVVFLFHYGGGKQSNFWPIRLYANTIGFGWAGVSLFFVLSGFLITGILWDSFSEKGWASKFYIRRSLRIFPLYYFALLIAAVVLYFAKLPVRTTPGLLIYFSTCRMCQAAC
jgi:peptidoglycan/LPS O-acetylase OafA/YrhL